MQPRLKLAALAIASVWLAAADAIPKEDQPATVQTDAPRPVRVQPVAFSQAGANLTFSGTVQARVLADLGFRVGGKIVTRPVEIGDHVTAGQVLARLDPSDLQFSQEAAEAAVQSAVADAANAQADLRRYDQLGRNSPAYLPSEYDKRVAAQRMATARLAQAQRQLALARDQRVYGTLTADADGIITALPVQTGQVVIAGQTIATVAHTNEVEIVADVPENRLAAIRATDDVGISLWALPSLSLRGQVREIGALADAASRTFAVKVTVKDAPPNTLALGMTAAVAFGVSGPALAPLPASALTDINGRPAVWVLDTATQKATLRPVTLAGYGGDGRMLVQGGVSQGDLVVTAGVGQIDQGMRLIAWAGAQR